MQSRLVVMSVGPFQIPAPRNPSSSSSRFYQKPPCTSQNCIETSRLLPRVYFWLLILSSLCNALHRHRRTGGEGIGLWKQAIMPPGAKKRKAAKKKMGQLGPDHPPTNSSQGNGGAREEEEGSVMRSEDKDGSESGDLASPASVHVPSPLSEDVKESPRLPLIATENPAHSVASVEKLGKEMSGASSSESSSSDEEPAAVEIPVLGEESSQIVSIAGEMEVPQAAAAVGTEASLGILVDQIAVKVVPLIHELKGVHDSSSGNGVSTVEEVVVEQGPPITEPELVADSIQEIIVPSAETAVVVDRPGESEIRETPDNQIEGGLAPQPRQATSWKSCCGLFELFGGAS